MPMHFEELWERCEKFHQEASNDSSLMDELMMKVNLYKVIDQKTEVPEEERQKLKSRAMGEILLTLTGMSLKDNVNVFEALSIALQYRSVEHYSQKYPTT